MKHLKLSRRELDEMKAVMGRDDRFRALFDHIAAVEAENADLRRDNLLLRREKYNMELELALYQEFEAALDEGGAE